MAGDCHRGDKNALHVDVVGEYFFASYLKDAITVTYQFDQSGRMVERYRYLVKEQRMAFKERKRKKKLTSPLKIIILLRRFLTRFGTGNTESIDRQRLTFRLKTMRVVRSFSTRKTAHEFR